MHDDEPFRDSYYDLQLLVAVYTERYIFLYEFRCSIVLVFRFTHILYGYERFILIFEREFSFIRNRLHCGMTSP